MMGRRGQKHGSNWPSYKNKASDTLQTVVASLGPEGAVSQDSGTGMYLKRASGRR